MLNDFVVTALTQKNNCVLSDGSPWRPLIHARDIGRAVAWASQVEQEGFSAYNVGSNLWTLTIRDLAGKVSEILDVLTKLLDKAVLINAVYCVSLINLKLLRKTGCHWNKSSLLWCE